MTKDMSYPYIIPYNTFSKDGILAGEPEDYDEVVYEKYTYVYSSDNGGYTAYLRDQTQTFNSDEVLSTIYDVPVINKNS